MKLRTFSKPRVDPRPRQNMAEVPADDRSGNTPSPEIVSLAGKVLDGYEPTREEIASLAGSILANAPKRSKA